MDWKLDALYENFGARYEADTNKLAQALQTALEDPFTDVRPAKWADRLAQLEEILSLRIKLRAYPHLRNSTHADDSDAIKAKDRIDATAPQFAEYASRLQRTLAGADIHALVQAEERLAPYEFFLNEQKKGAAFLLTEEEEKLYAGLTQTGAVAFQQLKETLTAKHTVPLEIDGETKEYPLPALRNLLFDPRADVRVHAFEAELESYKRVEDAVSASLNAIKGESITMAKKRGYDSPLHKTLVSSRMDEEILNALWTAIDDATPMFRKYLRHKGKLLGHDNGLPFYDLFAPIGEVNLTYTFEEASEYVVDKFHAFSKPLGDYAKRAVDENWIDVYPKSGKRGGAFCSNLHPIKESRFMLNFTGSYSNLTTLAHELGHGWHGHILSKEPLLNSSYPMPLAETASTFCELLVNSAAMKDSDDATRIAILENSIAGVTQTCLDIRSRFLFEDAVFTKRADAPLSVHETKQLMIDAQKQTYGNGLAEGALHPDMWINKVHYFIPGLDYYNFPYAFGNLFAIGLLKRYKEDPANFPAQYDEMLRLTGKASVADVAKSIGIDVTTPEFFRESLREVEKEIDEWIALTEKKANHRRAKAHP